jgi:hypothetical protein
MSRGLRVVAVVASFILAVWAFAPPVQAYLDPGAGSILLQTIVGGVAVVGGVLAHYWSRVRRLLGRPESATLDRHDRHGRPATGEGAHPDA